MPLHDWSEAHRQAATRAAQIGMWSWKVDTDRIVLDEQAIRLWGIAEHHEMTFALLSEKIIPPDRDFVRRAFAATRATLGSYEIDFGIEVNSLTRWISSRGQGDDHGISGRTMFGIFIDATQRKQAQEGHELLAGEMSHRLKNVLSIATALTRITAQTAASTSAMARDLTQRLMALGRAHDLIRQHEGAPVAGALLGDLLSVLLAPYEKALPDFARGTGRIRVAVPRFSVGQGACVTLALVIHELATNSAKYGALSVDAGLLDLSATENDTEVVRTWTERNGPAVFRKEAEVGFGSALIERSVGRQLGGSVSVNWAAQGIIVTMRMKKDRLVL